MGDLTAPSLPTQGRAEDSGARDAPHPPQDRRRYALRRPHAPQGRTAEVPPGRRGAQRRPSKNFSQRTRAYTTAEGRALFLLLVLPRVREGRSEASALPSPSPLRPYSRRGAAPEARRDGTLHLRREILPGLRPGCLRPRGPPINCNFSPSTASEPRGVRGPRAPPRPRAYYLTGLGTLGTAHLAAKGPLALDPRNR